MTAQSYEYNAPTAITLTTQDGKDVIMIIPDESDRPLVFIKMHPGNIIRLAKECSDWVFDKSFSVIK